MVHRAKNEIVLLTFNALFLLVSTILLILWTLSTFGPGLYLAGQTSDPELAFALMRAQQTSTIAVFLVLLGFATYLTAVIYLYARRHALISVILHYTWLLFLTLVLVSGIVSAFLDVDAVDASQVGVLLALLGIWSVTFFTGRKLRNHRAQRRA